MPNPEEMDRKEGSSHWGWILLVGLVLALVFAKWTLLVAILGLAFLITVHEFGHFVFAKWFGMRVERFYVGFPPAIWKRRRGETEYGIGMIPLGGFAKISGMSEEEELPDDVKPRAYYNQPVWKRNLTIFAGPLFNFLAAIVILFVFLLAQGIVTPTLKLDQVVPTVKVGSETQQTPAARIGLQKGDRLIGAKLASDSGPIPEWTQWSEATAFFQAHPNQAIDLKYRNAAGVVQTTRVTLDPNPADPSAGFLGVQAAQKTQRPMPWTAGWLAVKGTGDVIAKTFQGLYWLISGRISATGPDGAAGPVGIISISSQAVQQNWYPVLLALLSVNLGIINLLPILPFDGGHILFNTLESIRGRRISQRIMERTAAVGVALLLVLFVFLTFNDIRRLFGG